MPYGTDAAPLAQSGVPCVVFGPGDIARAHTCDESVPLDEVAQAAEILYRLASGAIVSPPVEHAVADGILHLRAYAAPLAVSDRPCVPQPRRLYLAAPEGKGDDRPKGRSRQRRPRHGGQQQEGRRVELAPAGVGGGVRRRAGSGGLPRLSVLAARARRSRPHRPSPRPWRPPASPTAPPADYCQRPVAFLHGNETITREQLGEYLIARYGADKLPLLVNKLIIEEACKAKGIDVTPAEVEASFAQDIGSMGGGITEKMFVDNILKQYKKSLFEWKEDVVRPKLLMTKLVRDRVKVAEEDIQAGYEAYYGEKVDCKIIYWPKNEKELAIKIWGIIHDSKDVDAEFDNKAMMQANPRLAAERRPLDQPIGRHTTGDDERGARGVQPAAGRRSAP